MDSFGPAGSQGASTQRHKVAQLAWRVGVLMLVLAGFWLRLHELARQDIWWDEARNIAVALRPIGQIAVAPELDIHPPVYFWLLHGWAQVADIAPAGMHGGQQETGQSPDQVAFLSRYLSVWFGLAGVALLYRLGRLVAVATTATGNRESSDASGRLGQLAGGLAMTLGAFSPFWLAESQETRMYTLGLALLSAAAVAWLHAGVLRRDEALPHGEQMPAWPLVWFVFFSGLALLTHYNAVFILAAWYLGWTGFILPEILRARRGWSALAPVALAGVGTALLVLPMAPIALRQISGYANPNLDAPSLAGYLVQNWRGYLGGYALAAVEAGQLSRIWLWAAGLLAAAGLAAAWMREPGLRRGMGFLLWWMLAGLALYYIAVLDRGAFNVRYSSFVTPALYAALGLALAAWATMWRPLAAAALAVMISFWPQAIHADLYDPAFARGDISDVAGWLREQTQPGDVVFVDQKYPIGFYYERYAIEPGQTPTGDEAAPARYLFVDINTIDERLNQWAGDAERVYWVQWFESDTDPRRAVSFLLDQAGTRGPEATFQSYTIDWWELNPPNHFELAPNLEPHQVVFAPYVQTIAVSLPEEPVTVGDEAPVVIRWQRREPDGRGGEVDRPLKARVALYDEAGARISQRDERLLNDRHLLPAEWAAEDRPLNVYLLDVPDDVAPGIYTIGLLVYDADTLEPVSYLDEAGNPGGIEPSLGAVELVRETP